MQKKNKLIVAIVAFIVVITMTLSIYIDVSNDAKSENMSYPDFLNLVEDKKVKEVSIDLASGTFTAETAKGKYVKVDNPKRDNFKEQLLLAGVEVSEIDGRAEQIASQQMWSFFQSVFIMGLLIFGFMYMQKRMGKGKGNKPVDIASTPKITFDQVAGNEEAKEDMRFLVDFLKKPKDFEQLGAKLPKGVILYGEPGTGKTLTAKAIAGEAGVPFFSVSGADFVEMYVGVGAKRVRELFAAARAKAPSIIFIDEIDALGGSRDQQQHAEQRQTLNAVLAEMDGFSSSEGVIVIGATNRLNDLDAAFMRPGRFDKHISIGLPDQKSRLDILKVHAKNKPLDPSVKLEEIAKITIGLAGAHLEAIMNEAAIIATTKKQKVIMNEDIDDAFYKLVMKGHKRNNQKSRDLDELKLVAWHEAGHALVAKLLTKNEVPKVTIISSTSGAGGVTFFTPNKMGLHTRSELLAEIQVLYAGRAAEQILFGNEQEVTTGAQQDIRMATGRIRSIITDFGMSNEYGMLNIDLLTKNGQDMDGTRMVEEARKISEDLFLKTFELLTKNKTLLEKVSMALLEKETLSGEELDAILQQHLHVAA
ncbi:ATP-dependent metallopeptidase FtsH/Yme1/Tma family protein [Psychrobacillus sp. FSL K6-1464]|uniref:ATP-dependent metallopeptidase FtsH/Yme1/Tma family protein n=1 Tax=Psychrobacillus sp. FSL K6-1464 TaxID=2921545 RepID=UPI0030F89C9C